MRYVVRIEAYVYADDAAHAELKANEYCRLLNSREDGIHADYTGLYICAPGVVTLGTPRNLIRQD